MKSVREIAKFDVERVREDFPILAQRLHGQRLSYLDNAATTQKPKSVIERIAKYYEEQNANVHRGVHDLSVIATTEYERARKIVANHVNATSEREIIFVRGTTEAINLVATSFVLPRIKAGDRILITQLEHHSNIVPWQALCEQTNAILDVAPITDAGDVVLEEFERLAQKRPVIASFASVSNALGTINPVKEMIAICKANGVPTMIDGAQSVPHFAVDVREWDCDFFAFSAHKAYGPTGIGALYGREALLNSMMPYQYGGDMILSVSFARTQYATTPARFEAGTPNIAGAIGMGEAIQYLNSLDRNAIATHEDLLLSRATSELSQVPGVKIIGEAKAKTSVLSFIMHGIHPHDVGTILNESGVAIRAGHHCAQPLMERFGIAGTCRASFALYNNDEDVEALIAGVKKAKEVFAA